MLVNDWCQQYPSHSTGSLHFGADGALYATAGDGASFNFADWGQDGNPRNPCGDPPGGVGAALSPPTAEGGALRSQDIRTTGDPTTLDGTVIRIDPNTGAGLPDNPFALSSDANSRRIVAHGLRNPFRFAIRPGTSDVWVGDVGWSDWEEINHLGQTNDSVADNFGWPCYEGVGPQPSYDGANLNLCESLYSAGGVTAPVYTYDHAQRVVPGESCTTGSSSISGMAFYNGGNYPASYTKALFFSDYSRNCIWAMLAGGDGFPNPSNRITFDAGAAGPVDLQIGPGGDVFYVDFGGAIRRIRYLGSSNNAPVARVTASPTTGGAPLTVQFDATTSSDPDPGDTLAYTWDLDGNGTYGDATIARPSRTYGPGTYTVRVRVSDAQGAFDTASILISANGNPPVPTIDLPAAGATWKVGDEISFSGHASDPEDGSLPPSALSWSVTLQHCPSDCHPHPLGEFPGVAFGKFDSIDHEYPSHIELKLTAQDSTGLTASTTLRLDPKTVDLTFASAPTGLRLVVGSTAGTTPFTRRVMVGSNNSLIADTQSANGRRYAFNSWSDGGAASHNVIAGETPASYTATFDDIGPAGAPGLVGSYSFDEGSGTTSPDLSGQGNHGALTNGPTWAAAGKYGGAISFDGVNDMVTIADSASLDLTTGMTLQAWVRPAVLGWPYRTVLLKETPGSLVYTLYLNETTRPLGSIFAGGFERIATGSAALAANTWTHLATTYDGTNLRLYVNGTLVTTTAASGAISTSTGALRIGANTIWPEEAFQGLIDEVRVYNRALTTAELTQDMNTPLGLADDVLPTQPTGFVSTGSSATSIATGWSASSDNVGVAGYRLFLDGAQAGPPTQQTSFTFTGLVCGSAHTLGVEAYDLAGNTSGRATLEATAGACDTTPPTVSITAPAAGATVANTVSVTANAADNDQVSGVQFRLDGANLGAEDTASPYAVSWDTRAVANGAHTLTAVARDPSGNITTSANVGVTVTNTAQPPGWSPPTASTRAAALPPPTPPGPATTGRSPTARPGPPPASTAARSPSTASTTWSRSPTAPHSTSPPA